MSFCSKLEDSKKVVFVWGLPPFQRDQLPPNRVISKHDNVDENEKHVDDDEDLEELVEGEAGVRRVRAYWLHQGSDHLLLVFQTVNILICIYF